MPRAWRQGDVLPMLAARELDPTIDDGSRLLVCSHSCDLQEMHGPLLALVKGRKAEPNGNMIGGKSIRYLQMKSASGAVIQYDIESLYFFDVEVLDRHPPWREEAHPNDVLAGWLAQRFDRLALPDPVARALKASGVENTLLEALKKVIHEILDVRVLIDESGTPPSLNFLIIYDAGIDGAYEKAKVVVDAVLTRANRRARDLDDRVIIAGANVIADTALTYAQWRKTRPFRVEYLSRRGA